MFVSKVIGDIGEKRRWWRYKARVKRLPAGYRAVVEALHRYMMIFGPSDGPVEMLEDMADLFEQSVADGTPIREIVGADPVEFIELFMQNYGTASWVDRERRRLNEVIDRTVRTDDHETR